MHSLDALIITIFMLLFGIWEISYKTNDFFNDTISLNDTKI
jgi:hypothetical protein